MSKENEHRIGIDDRQLSKDEFDRLRIGGELYEHINAPLRPDKMAKKNKVELAG